MVYGTMVPERLPCATSVALGVMANCTLPVSVPLLDNMALETFAPAKTLPSMGGGRGQTLFGRPLTGACGVGRLASSATQHFMLL